MKLSEWARRNGVHYQTAYRWFRSGTLPVPARKLPTGTTLVEVPSTSDAPGGVVLYTRMSVHNQRGDLGRRLGRLTAWAAEQRLTVTDTVAEIGSGLDGNRPKLKRLLADPTVATIVVEHRDRLARFGVEQLQAALAAHGRRVLVVDPGQSSDDLIREIIEALTSFCAGFYGRRGARNRALHAATCAKRESGASTSGNPATTGVQPVR
jgi:putative resolvase